MNSPITLQNLIDQYGGSVQTGPFGSQLHQHDYSETGIPVVMPKDIVSGRVNETSVARVPEEKAIQLSRHSLKTGDIVFPRRGEISKCALIDEFQQGFLCGTGCIKIELPKKRYLPRYLYYYLGLPSVVEWLKNNAVGTTMLNLNTAILGKLKIPSTDFATQNSIAEILGNYDHLIENNRRRIALLEQVARLLYKEWFVHLRFPGHEHVKVQDGMPEGWGKKRIADIGETIGGGTPSTKVADYWDGDITWVVPSDITKNNSLVLLDSERKITENGLQKSSAKIVPANTILMTSRASVGYFALIDREVSTNQGFINIIPHEDEYRMYILFNLIHRVSEIRGNAKGTTYPEISKGRFREMEMVLPDRRLIQHFGERANNIIDQIRCLKRQCVSLQIARDLLLPRLMNGEIVV